VLACPAVGGKPNCGLWGFDSGTAEGWVYDLALAGTSHAGIGQPAASSALAMIGSHSLALQFQGEGLDARNHVYVKVPLCAGGQAIDLTNKSFSAYVRLVTAAGSQPLDVGQGHGVRLWTGPTSGTQSLDFSVEASTGGGPTPGSWHTVYTPRLGDDFFQPDAITHIGFRFLLNNAWRGTIYVDHIELR
jgi:hypothetical protein